MPVIFDPRIWLFRWTTCDSCASRLGAEGSSCVSSMARSIAIGKLNNTRTNLSVRRSLGASARYGNSLCIPPMLVLRVTKVAEKVRTVVRLVYHRDAVSRRERPEYRSDRLQNKITVISVTNKATCTSTHLHWTASLSRLRVVMMESIVSSVRLRWGLVSLTAPREQQVYELVHIEET